jgi:hypothetical protein
MGFYDFVMHFWDEALSQDVAHINDLPLLKYAHVALGILFSCVACRPSYFIPRILCSSFLSFLANFNRRIMQVFEDIMGPRSWESI